MVLALNLPAVGQCKEENMKGMLWKIKKGKSHPRKVICIFDYSATYAKTIFK